MSVEETVDAADTARLFAEALESGAVIQTMDAPYPEDSVKLHVGVFESLSQTFSYVWLVRPADGLDEWLFFATPEVAHHQLTLAELAARAAQELPEHPLPEAEARGRLSKLLESLRWGPLTALGRLEN